MNDAGLCQFTESLGEDVGADARHADAQVGESFGTQEEVSYHKEHPSFSYQVESVRHGAPVVVLPLTDHG
ncbi:hypothetical protein GCM10020219_103710 [Nonomuraea dietziae]